MAILLRKLYLESRLQKGDQFGSKDYVTLCFRS